jgi:uncharacterized delta-60 repeat protein
VNGTLFRARQRTLVGRRWLAASAVAIGFVLATGGAAVAQAPGSQDPTFGIGGVVQTYFPAGGAAASDVVVLPDGKLVSSGWAVTAVEFDPFRIDIAFALIRYTPDGALDASFGEQGRVLTEFSGGIDRTEALARQADGKLIAGGWVATDPATSDIQFGLARYLPDGSLDPSFGSSGKTTLNLTASHDYITDVAVDAAGRIVVAGFAGLSSFGGGVGNFVVARYTSDGALDPSFGTLGTRVIDFGGSLSSEDLAFALALQPDGKIVAGGTAGRDTGGSLFQRGFGLIRLDANGDLDPSFGSGGLVLTGFGFQNAEALGVAIAVDGKIVVAGAVGSSAPRFGVERDFALARYLADGTLDPSFGTGGTVTADFFGGGDEAADVAIQPDGKIVAGGGAQTDFGNVFALARFSAAGVLDPGFGNAGKASTVLGGGGSSFGQALALQADDKIVLAGEASGAGFGLVRYIGGEPSAEQLMVALEELTKATGAKQGIVASLVAKLNAAQRALAAGDTDNACDALGSYTDQVRAQSGKALTEAKATELSAAATQILTVLAC